jgi:hypothetical protein
MEFWFTQSESGRQGYAFRKIANGLQEQSGVKRSPRTHTNFVWGDPGCIGTLMKRSISPPNMSPFGPRERAAALLLRAGALLGPPVGLRFVGQFPTTIQVQYQSLIKVGLIRGLQFIPQGYISKALAPEAEHP